MRWILLFLLLLGLSSCGPARPTMAGSKWASALQAPDAHLRKKAAFMLGNIGPSDPAVLPALRAALHDKDPAVRRATIVALVKYGPDVREALPDLEAVHQQDRDGTVRHAAALALQRLAARP